MPDHQLTVYERLENAIIARLNAPELTAVDVCEYPESEDEYNRSFERPRIYVGCHGAVPGEQLDTNWSVNMESIEISVTFRSRTRKGENGCFDLIAKCNALLHGFVIPGFERMVAGKWELTGRGKGVAEYNQSYRTRTVNQQSFTDNHPDTEIPGLSTALAGLQTS